ncbi:hypothetical protein Tco_1439184 [Tanacetum coccineum]
MSCVVGFEKRCRKNTTHMMNSLKEAITESKDILLSIHHSLKMLLDIISNMNRKVEDEKMQMNDKGKGKLTHDGLEHAYIFAAYIALCLLVASCSQEHLEGGEGKQRARAYGGEDKLLKAR